MPRFPRTLALLLTLSLLLASCGPQTADRRPQADGGQPTVPSPTLTLSPSPAVPPTITSTPAPPSLESLGLSPETQTLLDRQGWQIKWDSQTSRYIISQLAWDETSQSFTDQPTHEIGYIDTEGNLHTRLTHFSASENPDGTWTDTSTTQDLVIPQLRPNASTLQPETWNLPTWNLIETKNPAFEKTGILSITIEINGTPTTFVYNRELGFLPMPELSTDFVNPTPLPIEYVHSLAAHQFILLQFGEPPAFPKSAYQDKNGKNIFPGWAIQFQYQNKDRDGNPIPDGIKVAYLWPRNGKTEIYNPVFQKDGKVLWFMLINPQDGTGYVSTVFRVFNPKNPQNPQNGDDQLLIFGTIGSFMNREEREIDKYHTYNNYEDQVKNGTDTPLVLAQEGGYYRAIRNEPSLDSLLGMEGNDFEKLNFGDNSHNIKGAIDKGMGDLQNSNVSEVVISIKINGQWVNVPLPWKLEGKVFPISP